MVDDDRAAGLARSVGSLTGGSPTQAGSKAKQRAGQARRMWGQAVDGVRDFTADQPFVAVLTAAGLGAVVGFLTNRR